jgi:hypothetical protein
MTVLEKFVVNMYDRSSPTTSVDDTRLDMFARKQRPYKAIPPTQAALLQHTKRAAYKAGCIWSQPTVSQPETHSPADWGWTKHGDVWKICWTHSRLLQKAADSSLCGCNKEWWELQVLPFHLTMYRSKHTHMSNLISIFMMYQPG